MKTIKSISINTAYVNQEGEMEHEYLSSYTKFDEKGNVSEEVTYSDTDIIESKSSFIFDSEGHLIEETSWLDEEEISDRKKYTLDGEGKIIQVEIEYGDGSISLQTYEYGNNTTIMNITDEDGDFDGREERKYDVDGKMIEFIKQDADKVIELRMLYQYDANKNLLMNVEFDRDNDIRIRRKYEYDEKNRRISDTGYNLKGEVIYSRSYTYNDADQLEEEIIDDYTVVYEYDDKGRDLRHLTSHSGELESIKLFKYNEDNLLTEEISVNSGEKYTLTPQLLGEANTNYQSKKYTYEFYEE